MHFLFISQLIVPFWSQCYITKTYLCWTAPHQNSHNAPSDRTGLIWTRPPPPPRTCWPLWSTHTPPLLECRHLEGRTEQKPIHYFAAGCLLSCVARGAIWRKKRTHPKCGSPLKSPSSILPHLVFFHLVYSTLILILPVLSHLLLKHIIFFHLVRVSANVISTDLCNTPQVMLSHILLSFLKHLSMRWCAAFSHHVMSSLYL